MKKFIYIVSMIFVWYLLSLIDAVKPTIPDPLSVGVLLFSTEIFTIIERLFITLKTVFIALIISISIGYFIGIVSSFSERVNSIFYPLFNGIKSVPITVFLPLFLVVFHLDYFVIPMICVPLIATLSVNISNASTTVNSTRQNIQNSLRVGKLSYFRHVLFWETLETLLSTLRVILTYALTLEIALDYFMRYNSGIGDYINSYYESFHNEKYTYMYAGILVTSVVGILLVRMLDEISKKALKWKIQIQ